MHERVKSEEEPGFLADVIWKVIPQPCTICCAHLTIALPQRNYSLHFTDGLLNFIRVMVCMMAKSFNWASLHCKKKKKRN